MAVLQGSADGDGAIAIEGTATGDHAIAGVRGTNESGTGVLGESSGTDPNQLGVGVRGVAVGTGVWGESQGWMGVFGSSRSTTGGAGVMGKALGSGVIGESETWMGVYGKTSSTTGGAGVMGEHASNGLAGLFKGGVHVTANLSVEGDVQLTGGDLAEEFEVVGEDAEPGSVMVLTGEDRICACIEPYDRRVAGVVSGAGSFRPAIVLGRRRGERRQALALTGRVWCRVDASYGAVALGDLLTTSPTSGHAMLARDVGRAFGAVIGKALGGVASGRALVPVLVALQ